MSGGTKNWGLSTGGTKKSSGGGGGGSGTTKKSVAAGTARSLGIGGSTSNTDTSTTTTTYTATKRTKSNVEDPNEGVFVAAGWGQDDEDDGLWSLNATEQKAAKSDADGGAYISGLNYADGSSVNRTDQEMRDALGLGESTNWWGDGTVTHVVGNVDDVGGKIYSSDAMEAVADMVDAASGGATWGQPPPPGDDWYESEEYQEYLDQVEIYESQLADYEEAMERYIDWSDSVGDVMNSALQPEHDRICYMPYPDAFDANNYMFESTFGWVASGISESIAQLQPGQVALIESVHVSHPEYPGDGAVSTYSSTGPNAGPSFYMYTSEEAGDSPLSPLYPDLEALVGDNKNAFSAVTYSGMEANAIRNRFGFWWNNAETKTEIPNVVNRAITQGAKTLANNSARAVNINPTVSAPKLTKSSISAFAQESAAFASRHNGTSTEPETY